MYTVEHAAFLAISGRPVPVAEVLQEILDYMDLVFVYHEANVTLEEGCLPSI